MWCLQHGEALAGLFCSLDVGWRAAGLQVWMVLEQAVTLMPIARQQSSSFPVAAAERGVLEGL